MKKNIPQIKICGLTQVDQAVVCARLGADAIGLVFFEKSPRNVTIEQAKAITSALPETITTVGVFVNETFSGIMQKVNGCGVNAVQLHGKESPELALKLKNEDITVIKALYIDGHPSLDDAEKYNANAYLVECSKGKLPGGNAITWNWKDAKNFGKKYPLILAGGLSPDNIEQAISESLPDAVDVSSGVESSPGQKNMAKVKKFINNVIQSPKNLDIGYYPSIKVF